MEEQSLKCSDEKKSDVKDQFDSSQENGSFLGMAKGFLLSTGSPGINKLNVSFGRYSSSNSSVVRASFLGSDQSEARIRMTSSLLGNGQGQDIPDVSPHCSKHCFVDDPDVLLQRIVSGNRTKDEDVLESCLQRQKLKVHVGAGKVEKLNFDDANKRYMSVYFNDLDESAYCFPPVYEYKHPGEPFELDEKGKVSSFPKREIGIDTLHRERRGEHAEEHTVETFSTMFKKYGIPSFIIHGYNWKTRYLDVLKKLNKNISKLSKKVFTKEGEIDLLISLPGKCLFVVEVKAVDKQHGGKVIVEKVTDAFLQCAKIAEFLSVMIRLKEPICLIKVVVLPNCTQATVNRLFCMICRAHIISADDLSGICDLNNWLKRITVQYSIQTENSPLQLSGHLDIIGRLIGPASLSGSNTPIESIERTAEQIGVHGGLEKVREIMKWNHMTPQQLYVKWKDPKFLILSGPPGSGKTLLALSKAKEILEGSDKPGSVLYILICNNAFGLVSMYKNELSKVQHGNCEFSVSVFDVDSDSIGYSKFLDLIITLKKKHPGKTLHVILEEFMLSSQLVENPLVGMEEVGYVWLLSVSSYYVPPERQKETCRVFHGFEVIFLDWVMRMSRQNIKFANEVIQLTLKSSKDQPIEIPMFRAGHAVNGVRPSVYRMKCVCRESRGDYICSDCTYIRTNWLQIKAYYDLGLDLLKNSDQDHSAYLGLSLIDLYSADFKINESVTRMHIRSYRGCEDKVVFMNLSNLLDLYILLIVLTRSLGKIIILDGGCSPKKAPKYDDFINMISENIGIVEVKEVIPSEDDLKLMRQAWVLGIGRKVMEASMVYKKTNFELVENIT